MAGQTGVVTCEHHPAPFLPYFLLAPLVVTPPILHAADLGKYSGRKLMWHHSLGSCVIKAAFPKVGGSCVACEDTMSPKGLGW
jgi:hypothetical protein